MILLCLCLFVCGLSFGQQPIFSQFYAAPLYLNPALAGMENEATLGLNYRSQWSGIDIPYSTFQLSYIHPLIKPGGRPKHVGGLGLSFLSDQTGANGEIKQVGVNFTGAYNYHLNKYGNNIISFGIQGGFHQKTIDPSAFQWSSQYNSLLGYDDSQAVPNYGEIGQKLMPVINAGITWMVTKNERYSTKEFSFYQGFSGTYLNQPNQAVFEGNESRAAITINVHGGMDLYLTRQFSFSPHYLVRYESNDLETNTGAYFTYFISDRKASSTTVITAGGWYRWADSFIISMGIDFQQFQIGFSYDRNISSLGRYFGQAAAYELSLQYKIKRTSGMKKYSTPMI